MIADVKRKPDAHRSIRSLFIIGLVGLILAACGVTWLLVVSAPLIQKAALYRDSWVEKQDPSYIISRIEIKSNGLNMTIHIAGNCHEFSVLPCDLGTYTQTFTGEEPLTTLIVFTDSNGIQNSCPLVMNLSDIDDTKLQVSASCGSYTSSLFDKT